MTTLYLQQIEQGQFIQNQAQLLFAQTAAVGFRQFIRRLLGQAQPNLRDLGTTGQGDVVPTTESELKSVNLSEIGGTLGRAQDFDRDFRPLSAHSKERWLNVATAVLRGKKLPPVQLTRIGDSYYVADGHHRISVAGALGQDSIRANVTVWQTASKV